MSQLAQVARELANLGRDTPALPGLVKPSLYRFEATLPTVVGTNEDLLATIIDPVILNEVDTTGGKQFYIQFSSYGLIVPGLEDEDEQVLADLMAGLFLRWELGGKSRTLSFGPDNLFSVSGHTQTQVGDQTTWTAVDRQNRVGFGLRKMRWELAVDAESAKFELGTKKAITLGGAAPTVTLYLAGAAWNKGFGMPYEQQTADCKVPPSKNPNPLANLGNNGQVLYAGNLRRPGPGRYFPGMK